LHDSNPFWIHALLYSWLEPNTGTSQGCLQLDAVDSSQQIHVMLLQPTTSSFAIFTTLFNFHYSNFSGFVIFPRTVVEFEIFLELLIESQKFLNNE